MCLLAHNGLPGCAWSLALPRGGHSVPPLKWWAFYCFIDSSCLASKRVRGGLSRNEELEREGRTDCLTNKLLKSHAMETHSVMVCCCLIFINITIQYPYSCHDGLVVVLEIGSSCLFVVSSGKTYVTMHKAPVHLCHQMHRLQGCALPDLKFSTLQGVLTCA